MTHVVMLVANNVSTDTRVKKEALAVARTGLQVTVVGLTAGDQREESLLGPVRVVRVPVPYLLRNSRTSRRLRRRRARPYPPGYLSDVDRDPTAIRLELRQEAVRDATGQALSLRRSGFHDDVRFTAAMLFGRLRTLAFVGGHAVIRGRHKAGRLVDVGLKLSWRAYDAAVSRIATGARWRSLLPEVYDFELAFGPVVDGLEPDLIHAHDMQVVSVAANACARARLVGRNVPWIYDAHEYVVGLSRYGGRTRRIVAAWASLEKEYIHSASRVVTVSPAIAGALRRRYALPVPPAVVLNTPVREPPQPSRPSVRAAVGIETGTALLVYSGVVTHARGVHTAIEAMTKLPAAHLVVVCVPHTETWALKRIRPLADEYGVADRVHFIDPVPSGQVLEFLESADVGLIPILHFPSHEMSLSNKMFEYLNAGLPLVVSDCRTQAEFVRSHGVGEVFRAEDPADLAEAVQRILDDRAPYVKAVNDPDLLDRYSWRRQEEVLREVYAQVLGRELRWLDPADSRQVVDLNERPVP